MSEQHPTARSDGRDTAQTQYGLPDARDESGQLKPADHTFEWQGEEITVRFYPPTATEVSEWEGMGEEMSPDDMADILDDKLIKPDIERPYSLQELNCYVRAISDYAMESGELADEVDEELDRRGGGGRGN